MEWRHSIYFARKIPEFHSCYGKVPQAPVRVIPKDQIGSSVRAPTPNKQKKPNPYNNRIIHQKRENLSKKGRKQCSLKFTEDRKGTRE